MCRPWREELTASSSAAMHVLIAALQCSLQAWLGALLLVLG